MSPVQIKLTGLQGILTIVFGGFFEASTCKSDILDTVSRCLISLTEFYAVLVIPFIPLLALFNLELNYILLSQNSE